MIDGVLPHDMAERAREKLEELEKSQRIARPLGPRVLVEPLEEKHEGRVITTEEIVGSIPTKGLVIAIGDEVTKVRVGEEVFFRQYAGIEIMVGEDELLIFQEGDLLVVWR